MVYNERVQCRMLWRLRLYIIEIGPNRLDRLAEESREHGRKMWGIGLRCDAGQT